MVDVNLTGAFLCAQEPSGLMKDQTPAAGGSSTTARSPPIRRGPNSAPYTATKHAITGLTKSIALDGRAYDIACGQIDIGNAPTEMAAQDDARRAAGRRPDRRRADHGRGKGRRGVVHMASLPLGQRSLR